MAKRDRTLTIQFGRSTSVNYAAAVELAKRSPTYTEEGEGRLARHSVSFSLEDIEKANELLDIVGNWKSTVLLLDGKPYPTHKLLPVLRCYYERQRAYRPDEYCFGRDDAYSSNDNDLGCRHCGLSPYGWTGLKGYGHMDSAGNFIVDKERIMFEVMRNLEDFSICPALDLDEVRRRIQAIPDEINPKHHPDWEYVTEWDGEREIAVAVRKRERRTGQPYVVRELNKTIKIELSEPAPTSKSNAGCATMLILSLAVSVLALTLFFSAS